MCNFFFFLGDDKTKNQDGQSTSTDENNESHISTKGNNFVE